MMHDFIVHWKTNGYTIVRAKTKEEAMDKVENNPYDYIDFDVAGENLESVSAEKYDEESI